jgi:ribonuclease BN (tRNA processing enzyme)
MKSRARREFISTASFAFGAAVLGTRLTAAAQPTTPQLGPDRLVLLGTRGGPFISGYAPSPPANLIVYRNVPYIIDAGYGVTFKLIEAGLSLPALRYILITHHHSDHNLELGPLLYNSWANGLRTPVDVHGPAGLEALISGYWESNRFDLETRISDEGRPDPRKLVAAHEFTQGPILSNADVKVSGLRNSHPPIMESYALKFELGGNVVVFSGDTSYYPPLAEFAKGANYLVHEVLYAPALDTLLGQRPNAATLKASIMSHHTRAEDVGRIAASANVRTLVLNHFVPADDSSLTPQVWIDAVRTTFRGNVVVGKDMLQLPL